MKIPHLFKNRQDPSREILLGLTVEDSGRNVFKNRQDPSREILLGLTEGLKIPDVKECIHGDSSGRLMTKLEQAMTDLKKHTATGVVHGLREISEVFIIMIVN